EDALAEGARCGRRARHEAEVARRRLLARPDVQMRRSAQLRGLEALAESRPDERGEARVVAGLDLAERIAGGAGEGGVEVEGQRVLAVRQPKRHEARTRERKAQRRMAARDVTFQRKLAAGLTGGEDESRQRRPLLAPARSGFEA